jgi:hypothetical protein
MALTFISSKEQKKNSDLKIIANRIATAGCLIYHNNSQSRLPYH